MYSLLHNIATRKTWRARDHLVLAQAHAQNHIVNTTALHASLHAFCSHVRDLLQRAAKQRGRGARCFLGATGSTRLGGTGAARDWVVQGQHAAAARTSATVTMPRRPRRLGTPSAQVAVSVVMVTGMGTSAWET